MGGPFPSQQDFDAGHTTVVGADDRLVDRSQLSSLRGSTQLALQIQPLLSDVLLTEVDDLMTAATFALGLVHRRIRVFEEVRGELVGPTRVRNPDARRISSSPLDTTNGSSMAAQILAAISADLCRLVEVLAQDDELIARHARQRVARAEVRGQTSRDGDQQLVADPVAIAVVHQLEAVEIREQDRCHVPERRARRTA